MISLRSLRQLLIITGLLLSSISGGFIYGQISGMVDALRGKDSQITLGDNDVSWIASLVNITCCCGFSLVALLSEKLGRPHSITVCSLPMILIWVMIYNARHSATFIASSALVGVCYGGLLSLTYITIPEYSLPQNRTIYANILLIVGPSIGVALGHVLCTLLPWRTVALIGIIPTGLTALLPFFWIESPSWLASKGRFKECELAFRALHVPNDATEMELQLLLEVERNKQNKMKRNRHDLSHIFTELKNAMKKKYIWKLIILSCADNLYRIAAGKIMFSTLAITMLQEMTGRSDILLYTLFVDGFIVLGSIVSYFLLNKFKMRPILFIFGLTANIILITLSFCLYFKPQKETYFAWIKVSLLAFYFISVYAGPYSVLETLATVVFPLELKAYLMSLMSALFGIVAFLNIQLAHNMFATMGYHGVFSLNAGIVFLCQIYLWVYMPEIKGKTLPEIELYFKDGKFHVQKEKFPNVEECAMLP